MIVNTGLWSGVRHLVVERSVKAPEPIPHGSVEPRIQLDIVADSDVRGPDNWDDIEPLAAWAFGLKGPLGPLSGLELTALAQRQTDPTVIDARTPLGLMVVVACPKDATFNVVPWALERLSWFVAAAHQMVSCDRPEGVDADLWERWTGRLGLPGALGEASLVLTTERRGVVLEGVRLGELGVISVHRTDSESDDWRLGAKLVRLHAKKVQ